MSTMNIFDLTDTWNAGATVFTAIKMNATDTASAAGSLLMDLQVGGVSFFSSSKTGIVLAPNSFRASSLYIYATAAAVRADTTSSRNIALDPAGVTVSSAGVFQFGSGNDAAGGRDTILHRDAAATLAQRNGVNAQRFRLYNTFTDASNFERGKFAWESNVLRIGTEKLGTGTARALELQTDGVTRLTIEATGGLTLQGNLNLVGGASFSMGTQKGSNLPSTNIGFTNSGTLALRREGVLTGNIIFGGGTGGNAISTFEFGDSSWSASPSNVNLAGPSAAGTNVSGGNLTLLGGVSTGSADGGAVTLSVTPAGSSGTARNGSVTVLRAAPSGLVQFGGTTSSFPALKRSTTSLQVRLADDSAFTNIQGKLTTETAYTAGAPTATGYIVLYDSAGTAYKIPAEAL